MKKLDPFAAYALPIGLTEGVDIPLPGTPAVFHVRLPSSMDEDFNVLVMSEISAATMEVTDDGDVIRKNVDPMMLQAIRKRLFFENCILSAKGLPEGMTIAGFFAAYPMAARKLYEDASLLAMAADDEVSEGLKKLKPTQSGKRSGVGGTSSTTKSLKRASSQRPSVQN